MIKAIVLVLIGLVWNVYAADPSGTMVSTITSELWVLTPNCGQATKFAIFLIQPAVTGEYIIDTKLTTACVDTVLIYYPDKIVCNNDISTSNRKSKLIVSLVAGKYYNFYVGGYKDSCAVGTSVSLSYARFVSLQPTKAPTTTPTVPPASPAPYKIEFEFSKDVKSKYKPFFINAAARWQQIVTKDLPSVIAIKNDKMKNCFAFDPKYPPFQERKIDDLLIGANVKPLNGSLGGAAVCLVDETGFPRLAVIDMNSVNIDRQMNEGTLESTIMHEIGHTLGIGSLWEVGGLISKKKTRYCNYCYGGTNGNIGNTIVGRPAGEMAIIEDGGGPGTIMSHWKESVYDNELMTGYGGGAGTEPLSALTVYSLIDLGYTVDVSKAEPFTVPSGRRLREEEKREKKDRKCGGKATLKLELVHGFPKPGREKELEDLIIKNAKRVKHLIDSNRG